MSSASHRLAATMAEQTDAGELAAMQGSYDTLLETCVACHDQAPTASQVDLSALASSW